MCYSRKSLNQKLFTCLLRLFITIGNPSPELWGSISNAGNPCPERWESIVNAGNPCPERWEWIVNVGNPCPERWEWIVNAENPCPELWISFVYPATKLTWETDYQVFKQN